MDPQVQTLLSRLAADPAFADRYFADPEAILEGMDIPEADRQALPSLDREAVLYMADAGRIEPEVAEEHPSNHAGNRHLTVAIALWGCVVFVAAWLLLRPG
jgi:hypothetical protein